MYNISVENSVSWWWLLAGVVCSVAAVYLIVSHKKTFSKLQLNTLASLRAIAVIGVFFILANFSFNFNFSFSEKPIFIIAVDNSKSVGMLTTNAEKQALKTKIDLLTSQLKNKGNVKFVPISNENEIYSFKGKSSNLGKLVDEIAETYENQHVAGVYLFSDGIISEGISPTYKTYPFPVHTVGLGNPTPQNDVSVQQLFYNKSVLKDNVFSLNAQISQHGFQNASASVQVWQGKTLLQEKTLALNQKLNPVSFEIEAKELGFKRFTVLVKPFKNEFTEKNNARDALVEVIEAKEKILILAVAPHPDVNAIKKALEQSKNRAVEICFASYQSPKKLNYDAAVLYQIPNYQRIGAELLPKIVGKMPVFWVAGNNTDWQTLNQLNEVVSASTFNRNNIDKPQGAVNSQFLLFNSMPTLQENVNNWPPVQVQFGEAKLKEGAENILFQKVGNTITAKPLLSIQSQRNPQSALLLAEGIWAWRMENYSKLENTTLFDELFSKTLGLLIESGNKKRFKVYAAEKEGNTNDRMQLNVELYNKLQEPVYDQKINLVIKNEKNEKQVFEFDNAKETPWYLLPYLKSGTYKYTATCDLNGEKLNTSGEFAIKELDLEAFNTAANHEMLQLLADNTNGKFGTLSNFDKTFENIYTQTVPEKLHNKLTSKYLIDIFWFLFLVLLPLSAEWLLRKFWGGY